MAEGIDKDLCSICLSNFIRPKILVCHHKFCQICLENYIDKKAQNGHFPCPLCRCDVTLPEGGVTNLSSYFTSSLPQCDGVTAECSNSCEYRCQDCDQFMCRTCRKAHDSVKIFKHHLVVRWDEPGPRQLIRGTVSSHVQDERYLCSCEKGKVVEYLCSTCNEIVCSKCCIKDHIGHKHMDLQDEEFQQTIKDEIGSLNDVITQEIEEVGKFSLNLKMKENEVSGLVKNICDQIDAQATDVHSEVTRIAENMKEEVKKIYLEGEDDSSPGSSGARNFKKMTEDNENVLESLKASTKSSSIVLEQKSIVEMLKRLDELRQEVKDCRCRKMVIPIVPEVTYEAGEVDVGALKEQVGRVNRQGIFEVIFDLDELREKGKLCSKMEYKGLTWCIDVRRSGFDKVFIGLMFSGESGDIATVDYNINLVNVKYGDKSIVRHEVTTFKSGRWAKQLIHPWKSLCDRNVGFLDDDNQFKVVVGLHLLPQNMMAK